MTLEEFVKIEQPKNNFLALYIHVIGESEWFGGYFSTNRKYMVEEEIEEVRTFYAKYKNYLICRLKAEDRKTFLIFLTKEN